MAEEKTVPSITVDDMPGVVTVADWTMATNGKRYICFWCGHWRVVPDKQMPIDGFKSSEKWTLFAIVDGDVVMAIPGCQIKAWVRSDKSPPYQQGGTDCCVIAQGVPCP